MINKRLFKQIKEFTASYSLDAKRDQFFLVDSSVIKKLVDTARVDKNDRVLEVGPGLGFLTKELAKRAKEIIAIEIDGRFKPFLDKLPKNVKVIYGNAYRLLNSREFHKEVTSPSKTVSAIPYSQAQNMLHNYTNWPWYQGDVVWLAPASLVSKINKEPILGAYFKAQLIQKVPPSAFYPPAKTSSAIIYFKRIPDPKKTGSFEIYFRRFLYDHEYWKVKNTLRESLIKAAYELKGVRVTKNQARNLVAQLKIPKEELERLTNNIRPEYYFEIPEKLRGWFERL